MIPRGILAIVTSVRNQQLHSETPVRRARPNNPPEKLKENPMATSTNLPDLRAEYPPPAPGRSDAERSSLLGLLPGIALLFVVGYAGKFVEHFLNTWTKA